MLDDLGIDYVEGGYPGANPTDTELFAEDRKLGTTFTAFGMTRRPGRSTSNDPGLAALLEAKADAICFVAKSWDYHVRVALETTRRGKSRLDPRQRDGRQRPRAARCCSTASISSTATRPIRDYALACAKAAYEAGARWVVLCDTNGGTLPHEVETIVGEVVKVHPRRSCRHPRPQRHRAGGGEFARRGARRRAPDPGHAQRPRRALRQRQSRLDHPDAEAEARVRRATSRSACRTRKLKSLAHASHTLDEMLNRAPNRHAPYVGESAFATKAGIHASAIVKDPATYEHVPPERVGNRRKLLVSDQAGSSNVLAELERIGIKVDKDDSAHRRGCSTR